jgi:hypothetical protein
MADRNLSPAAQVVLNDAYEVLPWMARTDSATIAAAALRAAADQLFKTEVLPPGYAYSAPAEAWHYEFQLNAHRKLCDIAAELDGANG